MNASPIAPTQLVNAPPPNPTGSPLMGVVDLRVTYPDNQTVVATGAMIDSTHVLTAAHVLYSAKDGGYAKSIEAIPAANGFGDPFGVAFGTNERVDPSWLSFNPSHPGATSPTVEDIGLVTLDQPIGNSTGWFGLGYNNNKAFFTGNTFKTAGYPAGSANSGSHLQVETGKSLGTVSSDGIDFTQSSLPALPGQSGSPIYQMSANGSPVIYGVLTGADGYSPSNKVYAARITPSVIAELQNWEKADKAPSAMSSEASAGQAVLHHPAITAMQHNQTTSSTPVIHPLDDYTYSEPGYYSDWADPLGWGWDAMREGVGLASFIPWDQIPDYLNEGYNGLQDSYGDFYGAANDPSYWMNYGDPFGYNLYGY